MRLSVALVVLLTMGCHETEQALSVHATVPILRTTEGVPQFVLDLNAQPFTTIESPTELPRDVLEALRIQLRQETLRLAGPGQPYNFGCMWDPQLPNHRLLHAAINAEYAVVHFESGGFVTINSVGVYARVPGSHSATLLWVSGTDLPLPTAKAFVKAIRDRTLWSTRTVWPPAA